MGQFDKLVSGAGERRASSYEDWIDSSAAEFGATPARGGGWMYRCPAHDDNNPSLSVGRREDGGVLLNCFAGCDNADILRGFNKAGFPIPDRGDEAPVELTHEVEATWDYHDSDGNVVFNVVKNRYSDGSKDFRQRHKVDGKWVWNLQGVDARPIYRLPEINEAIAEGRRIWITEGEKDADVLWDHGEAATTNSGGVKHWKDTHTSQLDGATEVIAVLDNDEAGLAERPSKMQDEFGDRVRLMVPAFGLNDVADHFEAGHGVDDFVPYVRNDPDQTGFEFLHADVDELEPVWGIGEDLLWSTGEDLIIAGPTGHKKTTLCLDLMWARLGFQPSCAGYPVTPTDNGVLYLACDRPRQVQRAMRRVFKSDIEVDDDVLRERMRVWSGPLESPITEDPEILYRMAVDRGCDTVIIDSLKDVAFKLSDDEMGGKANNAIQYALARGIEIVVLHHTRKGEATGKNGEEDEPKPITNIDAIYGSTWITSGAGSVITVFTNKETNETIIHHVKEPAENIGHLMVVMSNITGEVEVVDGWDPVAYLKGMGEVGLDQITGARLGKSPTSTTRNERRQTTKVLERWGRETDLIEQTNPGGKGRGNVPKWRFRMNGSG